MTMIRFLACCLVACLPFLPVSAQEIIPIEEIPNKTVYTFSNDTPVQDEPYGDFIGKIPMGLMLNVVSVIDMTEVRGVKDIWYEVVFNYQNRNRSGIINTEYLADFTLEAEKGELFMSKKISEEEAELRVAKNRKVLSSLKYETPEGEIANPILWDSRGVEGWNNILAIPYHQTGCSAFSGKVYLAWNGSEVHYVGLSRQEEDPQNGELWGAQPNVDLIFPKDENGEKGKILCVKQQISEEDLKGFKTAPYGTIEWNEKGFVITEH